MKKDIAIISYLTLFGWIYAFYKNQDAEKSEFNSFHLRQSIGIIISFFLLSYFIGNFDNWQITASFWVFYIVLWVYGFLGALQGEKREIPLLGKLFQTIFTNL